eukprot:SM000069S20710  [mRNA]  locus=s69:421571:428778:+ [translate_table: standard]
MFWRVAGLATTSPVDAILDKEEYTLEELLDEDDLIQECKALNGRLVAFLRARSEVVKLVRYVVEEPPPDANDKRLFKYPFVACEIFTCEIDAIFTTLLADDEAMELLFSFLEPERPHGSLLAGYFGKVLISLLLRRTHEVMRYLQVHKEILGKLVNLIGITSIMEVLMRLAGADEQILMFHSEAVQWLADTNLLEMLVDHLSPEYPSDVHANTAETLSAIARTAPSALADQLSSSRFIAQLFKHGLEGPHANSKSALIHSLSVCINLLDPKRAASAAVAGAARGMQGREGPKVANPETVDGMLQQLGELVSLLDVIGDEAVLPTTYGLLKPPLGIHRLKIVEFIAVLLRTKSEVAREELVKVGAIQTAVNLFFSFPFNNMLHHQVESIVSSCLESNSPVLEQNLLVDCDLVNRLLEADKDPSAPDTRPEPKRETVRAPSRCGYMGHITRIANRLMQLAATNLQIESSLKENKAWSTWQTEILEKRNAMENVYQWSCGRPAALEERPADSDDDEFRADYDIGSNAGVLSGNATGEALDVYHRYGVFDTEDTEEGEADLSMTPFSNSNTHAEINQRFEFPTKPIETNDMDKDNDDVFYDDEAAAEVVISSLTPQDDQDSDEEDNDSELGPPISTHSPGVPVGSGGLRRKVEWAAAICAVGQQQENNKDHAEEDEDDYQEEETASAAAEAGRTGHVQLPLSVLADAVGAADAEAASARDMNSHEHMASRAAPGVSDIFRQQDGPEMQWFAFQDPAQQSLDSPMSPTALSPGPKFIPKDAIGKEATEEEAVLVGLDDVPGAAALARHFSAAPLTNDLSSLSIGSAPQALQAEAAGPVRVDDVAYDNGLQEMVSLREEDGAEGAPSVQPSSPPPFAAWSAEPPKLDLLDGPQEAQAPGSLGADQDGSHKAMEKALREGIVGEALVGGGGGRSAGLAEANDGDGGAAADHKHDQHDPSYNDANFWKISYSTTELEL